MGKLFRGRRSRRNTILANNAVDRFYAAAAGIEPQFQLPVPPKRRIRRPVDGKPAVPLESAVNDSIYNAYKKRTDVTLWRNNRGIAVYGSQQVTYGVGPKGASDWIGYRKVVITDEHLGLTIAQFVALEAKRPGELPDDNQQKFIDRVNADGGRAGWATSVEETLALLP